MSKKQASKTLKIFEYAAFATLIIYLFGQVTVWALFIAVVILCISVPLHTWRKQATHPHPLKQVPQQPHSAKTVFYYPLASELDDQP